MQRALKIALLAMAWVGPAAAQAPAAPPASPGQAGGTDPALTSPAARGATLWRIGDELVATRWRLVEMDGDKIRADAAPTLEFLRDSHVRGSAGCHRYVGPFASRADKGVFGPLRVSAGECAPASSALEDRYVDELQRGWLMKIGEQKQELLVYMQAAEPPLRFTRLP